MTRLLDIAPYVPPAAPGALGGEVYRRFQDEPDTLAIAVVDDDGAPLGLVERNAFLVLMAAQYGHALWSKRPISHVMKRDPVVADGETSVGDFCGQVLDGQRDLLDARTNLCLTQVALEAAAGWQPSPTQR